MSVQVEPVPLLPIAVITLPDALHVPDPPGVQVAVPFGKYVTVADAPPPVISSHWPAGDAVHRVSMSCTPPVFWPVNVEPSAERVTMSVQLAPVPLLPWAVIVLPDAVHVPDPPPVQVTVPSAWYSASPS